MPLGIGSPSSAERRVRTRGVSVVEREAVLANTALVRFVDVLGTIFSIASETVLGASTNSEMELAAKATSEATSTSALVEVDATVEVSVIASEAARETSAEALLEPLIDVDKESLSELANERLAD
ncbi:hypothetical protein AB1I63_04655 [Streptococcus pneumoniae]